MSLQYKDEHKMGCLENANSEQSRIANSEQSRIANSEQYEQCEQTRIVQIMANGREQWRIVANRGKWGTQNLGVNLAATWNRIFALKKHRCLSGEKVFLNVISYGFNRCKSVNTSLLGYRCVFCFLNVSDGQPQPES